MATFRWDLNDSLITYDLSDNDVSAQQIADKSNGKLHTTISLKDKPHKYSLPSTTLWYKGTKEDAERIFRQAFDQARPSSSSCKISKLLITEVKAMSAYIED